MKYTIGVQDGKKEHPIAKTNEFQLATAIEKIIKESKMYRGQVFIYSKEDGRRV